MGSAPDKSTTTSHTKRTAASTKLESRRARNRISQKCFRERQVERIKELEKRLSEVSSDVDESSSMAKLRSENEAFRNSLFDFRRTTLGLVQDLAVLADKMKLALDHQEKNLKDKTRKDPSADNADVASPKATQNNLVEAVMAIGEAPASFMDDNQTCLVQQDELYAEAPEPALFFSAWTVGTETTYDDIFGSLPASDNLEQQHQYQHSCTGADKEHDGHLAAPLDDGNTQARDSSLERIDIYPDPDCVIDSILLLAGKPVDEAGTIDIFKSSPKPPVPAFRSSLCEHLRLLESKLAKAKSHLPDLSLTYPKSFSLIVPELFSHAWPEMDWWFRQSGAMYVIERMLLWRVSGTEKVLGQLPLAFRPTALQRRVLPHCSALDCIPIPELRDLILEQASGTYDANQLLADVLQSFVVECNGETISLWKETQELEVASGAFSSEHGVYPLPFRSSNIKIDLAFFLRYPKLFSNSIAAPRSPCTRGIWVETGLPKPVFKRHQEKYAALASPQYLR